MQQFAERRVTLPRQVSFRPMDVVFDLATTHLVPFAASGDTCLFTHKDSEAFVAACRREGHSILGIECYRDDDKGPTLLPEPIADFSSLTSTPREEFVRQSCHDALHFIRTMVPAQTLCEFVLG